MKRKIKILIVEDEAINAFSMQRALIMSGYKVCELVSTGEEAVAAAKQEKPDLVIMDIILNGSVNGIEAAREIRSRSDTPILFITGYDERKLIQQIKSIPSSTYLIKPTTPKALEAAIIQALQNENR
jgi:1,2-diacylglycerol 3-beta-glucosyltransferase